MVSLVDQKLKIAYILKPCGPIYGYFWPPSIAGGRVCQAGKIVYSEIMLHMEFHYWESFIYINDVSSDGRLFCDEGWLLLKYTPLWPTTQCTPCTLLQNDFWWFLWPPRCLPYLYFAAWDGKTSLKGFLPGVRNLVGYILKYTPYAPQPEITSGSLLTPPDSLLTPIPMLF